MEANGTNKIPDWVMKQRQQLPLFAKVEMTKKRIREWCGHWDDMVYVAFSGGLDSTVLLHLAREVYPECPAVFHDTGLEYPEIREFVKKFDNVEWTRPAKTHPQVLREDGYPVVSKRISQYVGEAQRAENKETATYKLRTTGIKSNGEMSPLGKIPDKWQYLIDAPFTISDKCCYYFKKKPARDYEDRTGRKGMVGTRAEESKQREMTYQQYGCNGYDLTVPRSTPLAFWMDEDIRQYIRENELDYCVLYDQGYNRTGCMFCMLGCHMEKGKNRFQMMEETHPKLHNYCINKLGLGEILTHIGVPYMNHQLELFKDDDNDNDGSDSE